MQISRVVPSNNSLGFCLTRQKGMMDVLKDNFEDFYDVFEEIGKGHFAVVKRCVNKETGEEYAGKLIRKKRVCRGVPMEDIQREIRTLNQLEHPGIIKLHDIYDTGQSVVLLLELVTGGELFHYVSQQGRLTEAQSVHIVRQICEAVSHMHSQNIAHLDLKPENVLLVKKSDMPVVKVIDFGLSHRLDTVAEIKAMFGTPEFVAPEVVNFEKLTLATDMWAVGVITYILGRMNTGAVVFMALHVYYCAQQCAILDIRGGQIEAVICTDNKLPMSDTWSYKK